MKIMNMVVPEKNEKTDKTFWRKIGIILVKDDGTKSGKLEAMPVNWDGWFNIYEQDQDSSQRPAPQQNPLPDPKNDDVPF